MLANPSQIIISKEEPTCQCSVHTHHVHHREFPEVRAEGETLKVAALHLVERLSLALDHAPSPWRQQGILKAIEDTRAFAEHYAMPDSLESSVVERLSIQA